MPPTLPLSLSLSLRPCLFPFVVLPRQPFPFSFFSHTWPYYLPQICFLIFLSTLASPSAISRCGRLPLILLIPSLPRAWHLTLISSSTSDFSSSLDTSIHRYHQLFRLHLPIDHTCLTAAFIILPSGMSHRPIRPRLRLVLSPAIKPIIRVSTLTFILQLHQSSITPHNVLTQVPHPGTCCRGTRPWYGLLPG